MHSFCEKYRRCIVDGDGLQMNYSQQFQTDLWNRRERELTCEYCLSSRHTVRAPVQFAAPANELKRALIDVRAPCRVYPNLTPHLNQMPIGGLVGIFTHIYLCLLRNSRSTVSPVNWSWAVSLHHLININWHRNICLSLFFSLPYSRDPIPLEFD